MPRPGRPLTNLPEAIAAYEASDLGCVPIANQFNVPHRDLELALKDRGTWRDQRTANNLARRRGEATRRAKFAALPQLEIAEAYVAGASENALAKQHGISRPVIHRILRDLGVSTRDVTAANQLMMSKRAPEENARNVAAAHDAVRGAGWDWERRCRAAEVRHGQTTGYALELLYAAWFELRDLPTIPQHACGPYNIDLAVGPIAVEINGGNWHGSGDHAARFPERAQYILDQGWTLVVVWVNKQGQFLSEDSADYIEQLFLRARENDALSGQLRVIWCDGVEVPTAGRSLHDLALVPPRGRRKRAA